MTQGFDPSFAALLQTLQNNMQSRSSSPELAKYILANSHVNFGTPMPVQTNPHRPSLLNRLVDVLSRPNYAVANMFDAAAHRHNPLSALFRGLEGKDKTTFSDVIKNDLGIKNKVVQGLGGFAADVALDPTTYIGAGAIKDVLQTGARKAGVLNKFAHAAGDLPAKPLIPTEHIPQLSLDSIPEVRKAIDLPPTGKIDQSAINQLGETGRSVGKICLLYTS